MDDKNGSAMVVDARTMSNVVDSIVLRGDLSGLNPRDRARFYVQVCEGLGLNPSAKPFDFLRLNGKEVLYANKNAGDQLARIHRVNRKIIDGPKVIDLAGTKLVFAVCEASLPDGRVETATATVPLVDPINVLMKAETKAKRRATMSILGLAILDEMEVEAIPPGAKEPGGGVDLSALDDAPSAQRAEVVQSAPLSLDGLGIEQRRPALAAPAVVDVVDDLRAQASRAESLTALAGLWIAAKSDVAALDDRTAQERAWSAFKARARDLGATVKALQAEIARQLGTTPPDGTSGPRSGSPDTATAEGGSVAAEGATGAVASVQRVESLEAVAERAAGDPRLATLRAHIATKSARPALANSVRAHWSEVLADADVRDLYAGRLRATTPPVSGDPRDDEQRDRDARELVTRWAEGARAEAMQGRAA